MSEATAVIQVTSFHRGTFGGGAILGKDPTGQATALLRSLVPADALVRDPNVGEVWRVTGRIEPRPVFDRRIGQQVEIDHIIATWAAPLRPRGAALRQWITKHPDVKGVGERYADRLWDAFGSELYDILRRRDVGALAQVLDYVKASSIIDAFGLLVDEIDALEDLDGLGIDARAARAAIALFGKGAGRTFRENPYTLTLLEPWAKVDAAALASGILPSNERRRLAAVDVAAGRVWRAGGHTVVKRGALERHVGGLLGRSAQHLAGQSIDLSVERGDLKVIGPDRFQARAPWHIEREIEASIANRLRRPHRSPDQSIIDVVIGEIEREEGFLFAPEQRDAVRLALSSGVAALSGGAGTGKSTIIKAIMRTAIRCGYSDYVQVALSGRAAKRLREATNAPALTIYRYLKDIEHGRLTPSAGLLVIDEFSMVSSPDLWVLLSSTPIEMDLLFVGDPGQLPPIGPGNPAASIFSSTVVPKVELVATHRQKASSGIPGVAQQVRDGCVPMLPRFDKDRADAPGVFILSCVESEIAQYSMQAFEAATSLVSNLQGSDLLHRLHQSDVQLLSSTKRLAETIGLAIEKKWIASQPLVHNWGFHVGSKILWTKNSYDHEDGLTGRSVDIMNGALGVIQRSTPNGAEVRFDDGTVSEIYQPNLDRVARGWAITLHKAQGSAFRTVIVPIAKSRLLDRAMIYTAITRARHTAILVGDPAVIGSAIQAAPMVALRNQALDVDAVMSCPTELDCMKPAA